MSDRPGVPAAAGAAATATVPTGSDILPTISVVQGAAINIFVDRDLAYELLWNWVRTLSRRLRATNDKMTFIATTSKF